MREYLFVLVMAAAVTYIATPLVRWFAFKVGALAPVRDRDVHAEPMPRLGGVGDVPRVRHGVLLAGSCRSCPGLRSASPAVLLGAGAGLRPRRVRRPGGWTPSPSWPVSCSPRADGLPGIQLLSLPLFGVTVLPTPLLVGAHRLVVVVTINAVNFVDGLDGLAAGIVGIAAVAFFAYSYLLARAPRPQRLHRGLADHRRADRLLRRLPAAQLQPGPDLHGDSGSMLLGLLLAGGTISLTGNVDPANVPQLRLASYVPLLLPLAVLLLPCSTWCWP